MLGNTAIDSNIAIRYLNNDTNVVQKVLGMTTIVLPVVVIGELLFGAENSARPIENLSRYLQFIDACVVVSMGKQTAEFYSKVRHSLKQKGRPIPDNDIWIATQCLENEWKLATDDEHFAYVDGLVVEKW